MAFTLVFGEGREKGNDKTGFDRTGSNDRMRA